MARIKVLSVIGTRPEAIKMIPVIKALEEEPEIESIFVNTAQHREQLDQVLDLFQIKPKYDFNIMKNKSNLVETVSTILIELTDVLDKEKPDIVLVHGDTATTLAGAQASFFSQIPVGHVEAGLRTYERYSPFPEEMNRQVTGRLASLHFAATETNKINLLSESINEDDIFVIGNTVIDALLDISKKSLEIHSDVKKIIDSPLKTILLTTHRRENLEDLNHIYEAINHLVDEHKDIQVVFPVHKNPSVRDKVRQSLKESSRIHLLEPIDYYSFAKLMKHSYFIITDSGGIQEEAPLFKKPILVARTSTERIEGLKAGTLKLVGTDKLKIIEESRRLLIDPTYYQSFSRNKNPYGDGTSSKKIVEIIKQRFSN
ncbi:non-hydrolyzing UDP-N-acetylglucosamine 2-epimerase [Bacillus sp. Brlt_9]|uniref:non-hydrolyzing UDP-N-acetylglucosamine 2-epimerase n=1 Tax=Bacillus sp. Brlt_9 TaxID=3110916 RepID=UPI003F7C84B3